MITLYEKIIAKAIEEDVKVGSIILSEPKPTELKKYEVISVGHGVITHNGGIKKLETEVGDTIFVAQNAGYPITKDDVDYRLLTESDVIILEKRQWD